MPLHLCTSTLWHESGVESRLTRPCLLKNETVLPFDECLLELAAVWLGKASISTEISRVYHFQRPGCHRCLLGDICVYGILRVHVHTVHPTSEAFVYDVRSWLLPMTLSLWFLASVDMDAHWTVGHGWPVRSTGYVAESQAVAYRNSYAVMLHLRSFGDTTEFLL